MIFLGLIVIVILLSAILSWAGRRAPRYRGRATPQGTEVVPDYSDAGSMYPSLDHAPEPPVPDYEIVTETIEVNSLLSGDGIRLIFTTVVQNFNDFGVVAVILVAMIGVGVAEEAGLIAALIRKMVQRRAAVVDHLHHRAARRHLERRVRCRLPRARSRWARAAFASLGRNPLAGIAAAYAGVSATFFVNILITPADGIITEVTNEIIGGVAPNAPPLNVTQNFYFSDRSRRSSAPLVMTFLNERFLEPRLGKWDPSERPPDAPVDHVPDAEELALESKGLRTRRPLHAGGRRDPVAADVPAERAAAQPGDGRDLRQLALHEQPAVHHLDAVPRRGPRLRPRGEHA